MKKFLAYLLFSFLIASLFACSSNDNTTAPPQTPNISLWQVRADAGNAEVTLDWQMLADATTYNIYYISSADNPGSTVMKASGTKVTGLIGPRYTITGLTNNTKYWWFALSAVNANGESDLSSIIPATPNTPPPLAAPTKIRANAGDKTVTVTWNIVPGASSYNLHCWDISSPLGGMSIITIPGTQSSYHVNTPLTWNVGTAAQTTSSLVNNVPYIFWLNAEAAESVSSAVVSAKPSETSPVSSGPSSSGDTATVPQNVLATAGAGNVTVTWNAPTGATPYTSYNLYYYTIDPVHPTKIPNAVTGIVVSGLTNDMLYSFYLTAVTSSSPSFEVMATPNATLPPAAPNLTSATAGDGKVTLVWTAPTTGVAPTSYNIYWSTLPNVTKTIGAATKGLSTTPPLTTAVTLANGTKYYFVVTAVNANGESMESNELSATLPDTGSSSSTSGGAIISINAH